MSKRNRVIWVGTEQRQRSGIPFRSPEWMTGAQVPGLSSVPCRVHPHRTALNLEQLELGVTLSNRMLVLQAAVETALPQRWTHHHFLNFEWIVSRPSKLCHNCSISRWNSVAFIYCLFYNFVHLELVFHSFSVSVCSGDEHQWGNERDRAASAAVSGSASAFPLAFMPLESPDGTVVRKISEKQITQMYFLSLFWCKNHWFCLGTVFQVKQELCPVVATLGLFFPFSVYYVPLRPAIYSSQGTDFVDNPLSVLW